jgi:hypothetical protein
MRTNETKSVRREGYAKQGRFRKPKSPVDSSSQTLPLIKDEAKACSNLPDQSSQSEYS